MKNVLLATTALIATAGMAAAEVNFSGYARSGFLWTDASGDVTVRSRLRIQADMSTETDSGITLKARQRFQTEENATGNGGNGMRFSIITGGLTINLGNINGAIESAPNLYLGTKSGGIGLEGNAWGNIATNTALGDWVWTAYSSGGAGATDGIELVYSMNGITFHVHSNNHNAATASTGFGINGSFSGYTVGVAYESDDLDNSLTYATIGGSFGDVNVALNYAKAEAGAAEATKMVLQGNTKVGAGTTLFAYIAQEDLVGGADIDNSYGLSISHNLGGGASLEAGYEDRRGAGATLSAGVFFSF
jgi:outer membrane protein OmpU